MRKTKPLLLVRGRIDLTSACTSMRPGFKEESLPSCPEEVQSRARRGCPRLLCTIFRFVRVQGCYYKLTGHGTCAGRGNEESRETFDVAEQDEFFEEAQRQLDGINSFYRGQRGRVQSHGTRTVFLRCAEDKLVESGFAIFFTPITTACTLVTNVRYDCAVIKPEPCHNEVVWRVYTMFLINQSQSSTPSRYVVCYVFSSRGRTQPQFARPS